MCVCVFLYSNHDGSGANKNPLYESCNAATEMGGPKFPFRQNVFIFLISNEVLSLSRNYVFKNNTIF